MTAYCMIDKYFSEIISLAALAISFFAFITAKRSQRHTNEIEALQKRNALIILVGEQTVQTHNMIYKSQKFLTKLKLLLPQIDDNEDINLIQKGISCTEDAVSGLREQVDVNFLFKKNLLEEGTGNPEEFSKVMEHVKGKLENFMSEIKAVDNLMNNLEDTIKERKLNK